MITETINTHFNFKRQIISVNFSQSPEIEITLLKDRIITSFSFIVLWISSLIAIYSYDYISTEKKKSQFILLIMVFILSMLLLLISPNIVTIIVGWDGLGLSSFCLVVFFQNRRSINSGTITIITNRIGDCLIIIARAIIFNNILFNKTKLRLVNRILILTGAFTKRAQMPFSAWLPAAIAAPTPVSSLVHSSTLVTAGVYLLTRFNGVFSFIAVKKLTMLTSIRTSIIAGLFACKEIDAKKNRSDIYPISARHNSI